MKWEHEHLILLFTCCLQLVSTLVKYPGEEKQYYNILRRVNMDKFTKTVNSLITKREHHILQKAAKILYLSDVHDEHFFRCLKAEEVRQCGFNHDANQVTYGDFAVVKLQKVHKATVNVISKTSV